MNIDWVAFLFFLMGLGIANFIGYYNGKKAGWNNAWKQIRYIRQQISEE